MEKGGIAWTDAPATSSRLHFGHGWKCQCSLSRNSPGYDNADGYMNGITEAPLKWSVTRITARRRPDSTARLRRSGEATKVKVFNDGFEGHVKRSLARAYSRAAGERLAREAAITFADPVDLFIC
ncbi:MAG: hypothetical protein QOE55_6844 [Acidobacteriaceae bacterium]|jgi:hypothetical protein|nr:hypothetical protein [Acidobacteriaceae bacterium]